MNSISILALIFLLVSSLTGCSTVTEAGKGFAGVSTKILEEKRPQALKKSVALGYDECYLKVKEILNKDIPGILGSAPVIYAEERSKNLIAVYLSSADTTPVGIFLTGEDGNTLIEVSSASTYAKEELANRIFTEISALMKARGIKEPKDVKEESGD